MSQPGVLPLAQHNVEIYRNQEAWQRKPMLRRVYHEFYRLIAARIDPGVPGPVVELGSGMGRIKEVIKVDLPRPRSQDMVNTPEFGRLYDRALHLIREEVLNAMRQQEEEVG